MKTGFKDPIAVKEKKEGNRPWNFTAPDYDERSSCYVSAGSDYGVGHKVPVGSFEYKPEPNVIPKGRVKTLDLNVHGETWSIKNSSHSSY